MWAEVTGSSPAAGWPLRLKLDPNERHGGIGQGAVRDQHSGNVTASGYGLDVAATDAYLTRAS